ncbi:MAG: RsmE family RNA methyltransferase [Rectinemataceae bacterium]
MRQLVLPGDKGGEKRLTLDGRTSRYLLRVLKMGKGDAFPAIDEAGHAFLCTIASTGPELVISLVATAGLAEPDALTANGIVSASLQPPSAPLRLALVQALPKGPKLDLIVRQAVEAGVEAIFPIQTRHCVARELNERDRSDKLERRRTIVREALQQSGSTTATKIFPTTTIADLDLRLSAEGFPADGSLRLIFHELPLATLSLHEYCAGKTLPTVILIGPEGGFAPDETEAFLAMGFKVAHIEGTILRTETAALFALAAVKTILMEKAAWTLLR